MIFGTIVTGLVTAVAGIFVNAFVIWLIVDRIFRFATFEKAGFRTALEIAVSSGVISFVVGVIIALIPGISVINATGILLSALIINIVVLLFLIQNFYTLPWGETVISWLTVAIVGSVASIMVNSLLGFLTALL